MNPITHSLHDFRPAVTVGRSIGVRAPILGNETPRQVVRGAFTSPAASVVVQQVFLSGTIMPGWKIVEPLPLAMERDRDGLYIVSDDIFAVYGVGVTEQIALRDYVVSLIEYAEILNQYTDEPTQEQFGRLTQYLQSE